MKNNMKRVVSLLLALTLTLGSVFSLSSCFRAIDLIIGDNSGSGQGSQGGDGNGSGNQDGSGNQGGQGSQDGSGNSSSPPAGGGEVEFYPGIGEEDIPTDSFSSSSRTLLSTVVIHSHFEIAYSTGIYGGYDSSTYPDIAAGSGVIYQLDKAKGDAYIITNYHVVYNKSAITKNKISDDIRVYLYGQELESYAISATYVGGSMSYDIAVLKIENSEVLRNSFAVPAILGDSDLVSIYDTVAVVGNPEGAGMSVTTGIVSVDSETLNMTGADGKSGISLRVMRISAAVNQGNSGGGLYDAGGKLIGIVNAKKTGEDIDNIGYAIPINLAKNLADNILYHCNGEDKTRVHKYLLGITLTAKITGLTIDPETEKICKAEIVEVTELTSTNIMGNQVLAGDRINSITVNGVTKTVTRIHHVTDHMLTARLGDTVTLNITRSGQTLDISVTVTETALSLVQ